MLQWSESAVVCSFDFNVSMGTDIIIFSPFTGQLLTWDLWTQEPALPHTSLPVLLSYTCWGYNGECMPGNMVEIKGLGFGRDPYEISISIAVSLWSLRNDTHQTALATAWC